MRTYILFLLCYLVSPFSFAQNWRLDKANRYYEKLAYADAIEEYEILVKQKVDSGFFAKNMSDCYLKIGDYQKAEPWLAKLNKTERPKPENILLYANTLKSNQKYAEADYWLEKYDYASKDTISLPRSKMTEFVKKLKDNSDEWLISNLETNSSESDFSPAIIDGKLVFVSARSSNFGIKFKHSWNNKPFLNLFVCQKTDTGSHIEPMLIGGKINTKFHEGPITASRDGSRIFFTRNNYLNGKVQKSTKGVNNLKLYSAVKTQENKWINPVELPFNSNEFSVGHPAISRDGLTLYFASDMPGGFGGTDIYKAEKMNDSWSSPINLGEHVNTKGNEMFPSINFKNEMFFASDGHNSIGGLDIFMVDLKNMKSSLENLGMPVNSSQDDFGIVFDEGDTTGYFSSNRIGGKGSDDIYFFKKLKSKIKLSGLLSDKKSKAPIINAMVVLLDVENKPIDSVQTDPTGNYFFEIDPDKIYMVEGFENGYEKKVEAFSTIEKKDSIVVDIPLKKEVNINMLGNILDAKTKKPIEGVKITITNLNTKVMFLDTVTGSSGHFKERIKDIELGEKTSFQITLAKDKFLGKTTRFDLTVNEAKDINLKDYMKDITMDKIAVGADIGKLIDVEPIYFDVSKFDIRSDAATELDKIVEVMNQNPTIKIELGSHTDSRGSDAYNLSLSDKRAKASANYIISKGIDKFRIYGKGYGEKKLLNKCKNGVKCSKKQHQQNRRTEFKIVGI